MRGSFKRLMAPRNHAPFANQGESILSSRVPAGLSIVVTSSEEAHYVCTTNWPGGAMQCT
jgi:hypothetical protein